MSGDVYDVYVFGVGFVVLTRASAYRPHMVNRSVHSALQVVRVHRGVGTFSVL